MINEKIKLYKQYKDKIDYLSYALYIINYDSLTDGPKKSRFYMNQTISFLHEEILNLTTDQKFIDLNRYFSKNEDLVEPILYKQSKKFLKDIDKILRIPKEEYLEFIKDKLIAKTIWEESLKTNDYTNFLPYFKKMIEYKKRYVRYQDSNIDIYDYLLNEYEEGFNKEKYDNFFDLIKKEIVPLVKQINLIKKDYKLINQFDIDKQKKLINFFIKEIGYDLDKGCIRESIQPFTSGIQKNDCRITINYKENDILDTFYSFLHEIGHVLYNMNNEDDLNFTNLFGGASMGLHESQARMYENYFGRSYTFLNKYFYIFKDLFNKELQNIDFDYFYKACNNVSNTYIRLKSDELTYPIHSLIRYELEKALFNDEIDPLDAPNYYNKLLKDYLNLDPINDSLGIFQDVHYAEGLFGYYPTYTLGSAYASQMYNVMDRLIDVNKCIMKNDFKSINQYLKDHVFRFGSLLTNNEVLLIATKEEFNPKYYIEYLKTKFTNLYLKD